MMFLVLALGISSVANAGPNKNARTGIGFGAGFGEFDLNLFITGKHWLSTPGRAIDFSMDFGSGFFGGTANYLWHKFYLFKGNLGRKLPLYYGGGAAAYLVSWDFFNPVTGQTESDSDLHLGGQAKAGLNYFFDGPFDAFLEFSPIIFITPDTTVGIGGAIGGRYYW